MSDFQKLVLRTLVFVVIYLIEQKMQNYGKLFDYDIKQALKATENLNDLKNDINAVL